MLVTVEQAIEILNSGDVVAFPTETVYGLGADAGNVQAISKIFTLKGRPSDNPLIVHVSHPQQAAQLARNIPDLFWHLAAAFWPGPLTMVLEKLPSVADIVTAGLASVALRMPNHPLALELIGKAGPLTAPSANLSGRPSPTKTAHIIDDYGDALPVVEGGECQVGLESTVLDLTSEKPVILRPGAISATMLKTVLRKGLEIEPSHNTTLTPKSPGTKYTHYKPDATVAWIPSLPAEPQPDTYYLLHSTVPFEAENCVSFCGDWEAMGRQLYDHFRTADHLGYSKIAVERLPADEVHPLIWPLKNRISKATSA